MKYKLYIGMALICGALLSMLAMFWYHVSGDNGMMILLGFSALLCSLGVGLVIGTDEE